MLLDFIWWSLKWLQLCLWYWGKYFEYDDASLVNIWVFVQINMIRRWREWGRRVSPKYLVPSEILWWWWWWRWWLTNSKIWSVYVDSYKKVDFIKQKGKSNKIIQSKHLIAYLGTLWDRKNHHFIKRVSRSLSSRGRRKINISSRRSVRAHYQWRKMKTFSKSESWKISNFWWCVLCVCHILSVLTH